MNSVASNNLGDQPQRSLPLTDEAGTEGFCDVIANLRTTVDEDDPLRGEAEAQIPGEMLSGLKFLLLKLREGRAQLVQAMAESNEPTDVVRPFTDSVAEVVRDLGSYLDAKKQFPSGPPIAEEFKLRVAAVDDLHERRMKLLQKVESLDEQCRRGVLKQITGNVPEQQRQVRGQQ
jgi:hypothetical protein